MLDAIILDRVSKIYKIPSIFPWRPTEKTKALNNITFTCPEKKITCLLGPNGAGKTTIIKILAGLILPDSGSITIYNKPLAKSRINKNIKIGITTPNERSFYWRLTGYQNLDFYGSLYGLKGKEKKAKISEILKEVGLEKDADKPFRLYSSGMKQKLMFARALLYNPNILLLDEPTNHLDPVSKKSVHGLIKKSLILKRKATVLLCTHDLHEAQEMADRIILLNNGSIIAEGSLSSLRKKIDPNKKVIIKFLKMPKKKWEKNIPIKILNEEDNRILLSMANENILPETIKAAIASGGEIIECRKDEESLYDIFSRLTHGDNS